MKSVEQQDRRAAATEGSAVKADLKWRAYRLSSSSEDYMDYITNNVCDHWAQNVVVTLGKRAKHQPVPTSVE